jgi:preprotein translocase subunit SecD
MLHFSKWKTYAILAACLAGLLGALPNFFDKERVLKWPFPLNQSVNLGLDLQGGAHFLLSVDTNALRREWLQNVQGETVQRLREAKIAREEVRIRDANRVVVTGVKAEDMEAALRALRPITQAVEASAALGSNAMTIDIKREADGSISLTPTEAGTRERVSKAIGAAIEVVRRRLDPSGTREMTVVRQGSDRILVQIPGVNDPAQIARDKDVISQTAKMTFHEVHPSINVEDARQRLPSGYKIYPSTDRTGGDELLKEQPVLSGEMLVRADPAFDSRTNQPILSFQFNQAGARIFGRYSRENIGRRFAIVLDGRVITAPVIQSAILDGSGQITGNFTVEETTKLAVQLRSGALPAPLTIVEERTVGPSLGADSIKAGKIATLIGGLLVVAFMLFAYGTFGVFSIIAVVINIAMILALMAWIGSALTLPGIAGILLTIGMAVDANVLIFERIREELRNKSTPIAAIEKGFERAFSTIVDANLTTLIAGLVMFMLGSGPVKGFAVTLSLGILTTVFTAFTVTRLLVSWWLAAESKGNKRVPAPL